MQAPAVSAKKAVIEALDELPPEKVAAVLDFVLFLKQRKKAEIPMRERVVVRSVPIERLERLSGIISLGGDALEDTERLYSDDE